MTENDNIPPAPNSSAPEETRPVKPKKRHLIRSPWIRLPLKTLMWLLVVVLLIPVLLYVPPVQTFVKNVACNAVFQSTGMKIGIDRFRLKWPVDVALDGVSVVEASGDTMVMAREVIADVKLMPLLKLDIKINKLSLLDGYYRMVSPDSSMILKIKAGYLSVDDQSSADMANSRILLNKAHIKEGDLSLLMDVWKQKPSPTDSTSAPFFISANELLLENFSFGMSMLPTIDTLRLNAGKIMLREGIVDLAKNLITVKSLQAATGDMTYLTPTPEYVAAHPAPVSRPDSLAQPSAPMVIKGDSVSLTDFKALYAIKDAKPLPGFDPSFIQVDDVNVALKDFYNASFDIRLPITSISAKERSGLQITSGSGTFAMDSTGMSLQRFDVSTPFSRISATAGIPFALMTLQPAAPVNVLAKGSVGFPDVEAFMPALKEYTSRLPRRSPLNFELQAEGKINDVDIPVLTAAIPGVFSIDAQGKAQNALDYKKLVADIDFEGSVTNPAVVDGLLGKTGFRMPSLSLKGNASALRQTYTANFRLLSSAGDVTADGRVSLTSEAYRADIGLRNVNVAHFMPDMGIGEVTASLKADGAGFNPTKPHASTDINLDIASIVYMKKELRDIIADVSLHDGAFYINAVSKNEAADFHLEGSGTIAPDLYTFNLFGEMKRLDLQALGLSPEANHGCADLHVSGTASPEKWLYDINLRSDSLEWTAGNQYFRVPGSLAMKFKSYPEKVQANIEASLTNVDFSSPAGLKQLVASFSQAADSIMKQTERKNINVETLQATLPPFTLNVNASGRGLVGKYLNTIGMSVDTIYADILNDSIIKGRIGLFDMANSRMRVDTLTLDLNQRHKLLDYRLHMGNRRNNATLSEFADVNVNGYLGENRGLVSITQKNQEGKTGYRLGMTVALADSLVNVHFTPRKATVAYLPWTFNFDNHIDVNLKNYQINANLLAESDKSSIKLLTVKGRRGNDELTVAINNLQIQDFLRMSVFAPPLTAAVNANLKVGYTNNWLYGNGDVAVSDFTYDKLRVGNFDVKLGAAMNDDGTSGAGATLKIDGQNAMTATVRLKPDSITKEMVPQKANLNLIRFPLYIANAFLGPDVARLSGYLKGKLAMGGSFSAPVLNGAISCDSVGVFIPMIGSQLRFNNDSVMLADNVVSFNQFDIWGANGNPLVVNGSVDARKFSAIKFDLGLKANDFQVINNDKRAKSDIYGKLFVNLNATAKGPMEHFNINADLDVLSSTDVTYSIPETSAELTQQNAGDVVTFVNFNDTAKVVVADTVAPMMAMRIVANLTIDPGAVVSVNIPGTATTGSGKVQLSPSGSLDYFQNYMGDMRLNGQIDLGDGYARYSIPIVGEKKFTFNPESYIQWNGELMNPTLRIDATDKVKANLLMDGNTRLVNFLVGLNITNTLSAPKVLFDLSTDDDMTIRNDLLSMSADQRSMAAINLLLTGQYKQQGVSTASPDLLSAQDLTGKLYGMLTGQLNSWLANNVRGVDLSFGIDQYDRTNNGVSGTATSYSYSMSKSLFNNRFKISVGGNYTTDASADENFSENLINDISFEYILKQTSATTMYMRLFRHTGYESILEGEITETGVGFVMRRRLSDLRELFRLGRKKAALPLPVSNDSTSVKPDADLRKESEVKEEDAEESEGKEQDGNKAKEPSTEVINENKD